MMKSMSAVCILVITVYLSVDLSATFNDEKILDNKFGMNGLFGKKKITTISGTNLTCPSDPVCNLTSIRCKSNSDCYPAMPVCCVGSAGNSTQGIRCCNSATQTQRGQPICTGNNPPPACLTPDVCTSDDECLDGERCCRTYFAGRLLNNSCCINATRGLQCPAAFDPQECQNNGCGGTSACTGAGRICCTLGDTTCCVFPRCPSRIINLNQCAPDAGGGPAACNANGCPTAGQICCHPGNVALACCVVDPPVG